MIEAGLCTDDQYEYGKDALLSHLTRYHNSKSASSSITTYSPTRNNGKVASKWSDDEDDKDLLVSTSVMKARDELDQYPQ